MSTATKQMLFVFVCLLIISVLTAYVQKRRHGPSEPIATSQTTPSKTYLDLRQQALKGARGKVNLPPPNRPTDPYAVLMDWHTGNGIVTVVAVADGSASIYLSGGGGSIGGGQTHPEIRDAALKAISLAAEFQPQMQRASTFPLPHSGGVIFYAVTDSGAYSSASMGEELADQRDPLSRLGNAMQNIITLYRIVQPDK